MDDLEVTRELKPVGKRHPTPTEYVVLRRNSGDVFEVIGRTGAFSNILAVKEVATDEGIYKAVPLRSFKSVEYSVEKIETVHVREIEE
jgi:hypothetical protein